MTSTTMTKTQKLGSAENEGPVNCDNPREASPGSAQRGVVASGRPAEVVRRSRELAAPRRAGFGTSASSRGWSSG